MRDRIEELVDRTFGALGYELWRKGERPLDAFTIQKELIKAQEPVVFDIGAHEGTVTRKYRKMFPLAGIFSFEPSPQTFEQLRRNTAKDARISAHKIAMSDKKGKALFHVNSLAATDSLLPADARASFYWGEGLYDNKEVVEVDTISIDAFCREKSIRSIDILKLDVQGAEYEVFLGAGDMLSSQSISLIYTELMLTPTYKGQHKLHDYLALLDSLGYEVLDFYNFERHGRRLIQMDVVLLSSAFMKQVQ